MELAHESAKKSAAPASPSKRQRTGLNGAADADYKARLTEFVSERRQKREHVMTPARIQRNRVIAFKHGLYAKSVTPDEVLRYRLARADPELPGILDAYLEAQKGNLSPLDLEIAKGFAEKRLVRNQVVMRILREGVEIEEPILNSQGRRVGNHIRANPLFDALKSLDEQLGITVEQARLSRRSRGQGERDDAVSAALLRDARLRAADKSRLPPPDPEILREKEPGPEAADVKARDEDEKLPS